MCLVVSAHKYCILYGLRPVCTLYSLAASHETGHHGQCRVEAVCVGWYAHDLGLTLKRAFLQSAPGPPL